MNTSNPNYDGKPAQQNEGALMKSSLAVLTAGLICFAIGSMAHMNASQSTPRQGSQEDVLPALLVEVRGLRAAMEQMASAGPRVQLALGRVQLQEQRVNNLLRRLEDSRNRLAEAQRNYDRMQQEQQSIAAGIREPRPEGPPPAELQNMQRATQQELERLSADIQRMTAETTTLDADLAAEQGRWIDLNQRMETLEQSLIRK
jgi:chromosome segregation ATPase